MYLQIRNPSEEIIAGRCDIQPDMIICKETDHGGIFYCCDPMLYLVELKALYSTAYVFGGSPFAGMCFQS